ncbi:hypothetical protein FACS1894216_08670 [Synergistales bacterium]|nr:hypothetical protein FACS1894216_08670 [Synergistales bacterium]
MSRAFVKEDDAEFANIRDSNARSKETLEWLRIQEKKLDFLLNDPKGQAIDAEKREKWIKDTEQAIKQTKQEMGI